MKQRKSTYQLSRSLTKTLQEARDGDHVVVTCEGKTPVVIHAYNGELCTVASPRLCTNCGQPAIHQVGDIDLCQLCYEKAVLLSSSP